MSLATMQISPAPILNPENVLPRFFKQPTELIGEVLQWLDLKDLLNLRTTSHALHQLVHGHEKSICARFSRRLRRENDALQLPIKMYGIGNDLLFYIELCRRYYSILELSNLFSDHIASRMQLQPGHSNKCDLEHWRSQKAARLHRRLFPALFLLNNFLECLNTVFLCGDEAFSDLDDSLFLAMHDIYDLDQQRIIEDFQPCNIETVMDVTAAFAIFIGVCNARKLTLSTKSPKYPFATIKKMIISCGLVPFRSILQSTRTLDERRHLLDEINNNIWQGKGRKPVTYRRSRLRSIHHLESERIHLYGELQTCRSHKTRNKFVENQDVWHKAAFAVLQRKNGTGNKPPDTDAWIKSAGSDEKEISSLTLADWTLPDAP